MKNDKGYLLLESVISLIIIITILLSLYSFINFSSKYKQSIEDKIELYEQSLEIQYQINNLIESSEKFISISDLNGNTINSPTPYYESVKSIKCKCINENKAYGVKKENNKVNKNKEISYKNNTNKLFINTLFENNCSEPGGTEIGDYVDSISIKMKENKVSIKLILSKNKEKYEVEFNSYIKKF